MGSLKQAMANLVQLFSIFCILVGVSASGTECPDAWMAFDGSCYKFATPYMNYTRAEDYCHQLGAHLLHVNTQKENTFIRTFLHDFDPMHYRFWVGITDEGTNSTWVLSGTNIPVPVTDWLPGEPNYPDEHCAMIAFSSNHFGSNHFGWADVECQRNFRPLCEISEEIPTVEVIG